MSKRVLVLTDEELDRVLRWYEDSASLGDMDWDEEDEDVAEKLRAARLGRGAA